MDQALRRRRGRLEVAWASRVASGPAAVVEPAGAGTVRPEVEASWRRSAGAVQRGIPAAPVEEPSAVVERWASSPIGRASRVILDDLGDLASDGDIVAAVTDDEVRIAWLAGGSSMRRRAEAVHFCVGGHWGEDAVGTNALALAERTGRSATVFAAEHFAPIVHDWVCYSAPVLDPTSGRVAGVVDLSTVWHRATPSLRTTVGALARCVEYELRRLAADPVTGGVAGVSLRTLGGTRCAVDGERVAITPRQAELLAVLSMHPDGLTLDEVTGLAYGDHPVTPSTVKAELSRLRHLLGGRIASRPYRLVGPVDTDHGRCLAALRRGDVRSAMDAYGGQMLPLSESPEIRSWRHHIDVGVRHAVVASGDVELLGRLSMLCRDDLEVQEAALAALPARDRRRSFLAGSVAAARVV